MKGSKDRKVYTLAEKLLLTGLVSKYKIVIECKRTDRVTTQGKQQCWDKISQKFNAELGVCPRTAEQLKKCWENLKTRSKKELDTQRKSFKETGGEPPETFPVSRESQAVIQVIGSQWDSIDNTYDEDDDDYDGEHVQIFTPDEILDDKSLVVAKCFSLTSSSQAEGNESSENDKEESAGKGKLTQMETCLIKMEESKHELEIQILKDKKLFQEKEHQKRLEILKLEKIWWEKRIKKFY